MAARSGISDRIHEASATTIQMPYQIRVSPCSVRRLIMHSEMKKHSIKVINDFGFRLEVVDPEAVPRFDYKPCHSHRQAPAQHNMLRNLDVLNSICRRNIIYLSSSLPDPFTVYITSSPTINHISHHQTTTLYHHYQNDQPPTTSTLPPS